MPRRLLPVVLAVSSVLPHSASAQVSSDERLSGVVMVFAAASLTEAFRAAAAEIGRRHPGVSLEFNFAGSPTLAGQIEQGAPADVFASADESTMQRVVAARLAHGLPAVFAQNRLAIAVPAGNPKQVASLADLTRPGLVIALCAPAVPAGRYATEAFAKAGLPLPEASREADVKGVLTKVALGEVDAGIVYATDTRAAAGKVEEIAIPERHNVIARYPIVVVKGARNPSAARAFVSFILSDAGQGILTRLGFLGR